MDDELERIKTENAELHSSLLTTRQSLTQLNSGG